MQKLWRMIAWTLALLAGAALLSRALFLDVWTIPEGDPRFAAAIAPTLSPGDTVLVFTRGTPGFGDLVRCVDPNDKNRFIAARIVGVPGDHLEVDDRTLRVGGRSYDGELSCPGNGYTILHPRTGAAVNLACDVVRMGGGWHYRAYNQQQPPFSSPTRAQVADGMVFLLSDDRSFHDDSRDFGAVEHASCEGPIFFRLWGEGGLRDEGHRFIAIH
jgi:signal peptidase I